MIYIIGQEDFLRYTAGVKIRKCSRGVFVEDVEHFRGTPDKVRQRIKNVASQDGPDVVQVLQKDPGQAGVSEAQALVSFLEGVNVRVDPVPKQNKVSRAYAVSSQCEAGNVKLVKGAWNKKFLDELEAFPNPSVHDDQVDGLSGGYNYLTGNNARIPQVRSL